MTGLYLHVPFCTRRCHYCNFVVTTAKGSAATGRFLAAVSKETARHRQRFLSTSFGTLYLGGGTPSALSTQDLGKLLAILKEAFTFEKTAEITVEANPGDIDAAKAAYLKLAGVNRISLGAQTFHARSLEGLNRSHGPEAIATSFQVLRKAGFDNISLDLMLSLPGETMADVRQSVESAVALEPEHLSVYELTVEDRTVFGERHKKGLLGLPSEEVQNEMLSWTRLYLKRSGYEHYELLSYAKPGKRSRHNLIYWANREYLGLGPGAFSYFDSKRFRLADSFETYLDKVEKGDWTPFEEETLHPDKKEVESLVLALRLTEGADANLFSEILERSSQTIDALIRKDLLEYSCGKIRLTPNGQLFAETVFSELSST